MYEERVGLSLTDIARRIHSQEVSATHALEDVLEHIAHADDTTNAFVKVLRDEALQEAEAADHMLRAGHYLGPLHGVPVAIKDILTTAGITTTAGSKILADWKPEQDATVVRKLRQAGAVIIGKTNLHEFAFGVTTENPHYGNTRNPWNPDHVPGGSSGGSGAAVAMGMGYMAIGTDTGGSIRIPATLCGVSGIKPTYGRVSRFGCLPLSWSLDHVGPLARTAEDCARALQVLAGHDPLDPTSANRPVPNYLATLNDSIEGLTIGIPGDPFWDPIDPEVEAAVRAGIDVLKGLGARIVDVEFPLADDLVAMQTTILFADAAAYHHRWMRERPQDYDSRVLAGLQQGATVPAVDYVNAQRLRAVLREKMNDVYRRVDLLAMPTTPVTAPKIGQAYETVAVGNGQMQLTRALTRNMSPFNLLGVPVMTVPCGFSSDELPIGLQIAGRAFDEATVLRAGHAYQQETDWHTWRPPQDTTP